MTESRLESHSPGANEASPHRPETASLARTDRVRTDETRARRDGDDIRTLRYGVEALRRASALGGVSSAELARVCSISRAAAYRVLRTLADEGYLLRDGPLKRARYRLSGRARALASGYDGGVRLLDVAVPLMLAWTEEHGWPLALATPVAERAVVRFTTDAVARRALVRYRAGRQAPALTIASTLVCLAWRPAGLRRDASLQEFDGLLAGEPLLRRLACVRRDGFALCDAPALREVTLAIPLWYDGAIAASLALRYMRVAEGGPQERASRLAALQALGTRIVSLANAEEEPGRGV